MQDRSATDENAVEGLGDVDPGEEPLAIDPEDEPVATEAEDEDPESLMGEEVEE